MKTYRVYYGTEMVEVETKEEAINIAKQWYHQFPDIKVECVTVSQVNWKLPQHFTIIDDRAGIVYEFSTRAKARNVWIDLINKYKHNGQISIDSKNRIWRIK